MTEHRPNDVIHQAFFGWSHDAGKLDLIAHSYQHDPEATRWLRKLEAHIRLQPDRNSTVPPEAMSYLDFTDGSVVVLRRVGVGHSIGRNNSHALIGSAAVLTVPVALGLGGWSGWQDKSPPTQFLQTIPAASLAGVADLAEQLRPQAERWESQLSIVLTRLLDDPDSPLSIIGCPDKDRLAMVWALRGVADGYLRQQYRQSRKWSFSTYEVRHDNTVARLPEIVFLPEKPEGAAPVDRAIIDLNRAPVSSHNRTTAEELVANFFHGTPLAAQESVRETVTVGSGAVAYDVEHAGPVEPQPGANDVTHHQVRTDGHWAPDQGAVQIERHPAAILLSARSVREFQGELNRLAAQGRHNRKKLRAALDVKTMNQAVGFVETDARLELLNRLLEVVYGPGFEDLRDPDAVDHAAMLVNRSQSEQLAMMLAGAAARAGRQKIFAAAFDRWAAGGYSSGLVPTGRSAQLRRWARRSRRLSIVSAVAAVALLVTFFLLGFVVGRPAAVQQNPSDSGQQAAPSISTAQLPNEPAGADPGQQAADVVVTTSPAAQGQLLTFIKNGEKYYPQSLCTSQDHTTWLCKKVAAGKFGLAILVRQGDVNPLLNKAAAGKDVALEQDWTIIGSIPNS
jgi:hypothetical protein